MFVSIEGKTLVKMKCHLLHSGLNKVVSIPSSARDIMKCIEFSATCKMSGTVKAKVLVVKC